MRKSKPVLLAAGAIWIIAAIAFKNVGQHEMVGIALRHSLLEYAELLLFLLVAMTYINSLEERNVFQVLRAALVNKGYSYRTIFWVTGIIAFFLSAIADNLTTALVMGAVITAVGRSKPAFVAVGCVNVVVAANAGGAFCPFGDITTLMVWQKGKLGFFEFFELFVPSLINWLVPALMMSFTLDAEVPEKLKLEVKLKKGAGFMICLFILTILTAVISHMYLHLPTSFGMMVGLSYLGIYSYFLRRQEGGDGSLEGVLGVVVDEFAPSFNQVINDPAAISQIVDNNHFPAFAIDMEHRVTHWNSKLEDLTNVRASDVIGTCRQWGAFYEHERPVLADLVNSDFQDSEARDLYSGNIRRRGEDQFSLDGMGFYKQLGNQGKFLAFTAIPICDESGKIVGAVEIINEVSQHKKEEAHFDVLKSIAGAEWDTLLFFYGVILCVSGLALFGYLDAISNYAYHGFSATFANSAVGVISAVLDNIPVMLSVLTMDPTMDRLQWLLVTLTAGTGGSLLAIGSAAGVALLGTARGSYTFGSHLKWAPAIMLGYIASIITLLAIG